jgi:K+-sensing histidine kinase KdpD
MKELGSLNTWSSNFISLISHEIRTPLTTIISFAQTLADEEDVISNEEQKQFLKIIEREGKRISHYLSELADVMRAETGSSINLSEIDLNQLIYHIVNESKHDLKNSVELCPSQRNCLVQADEKQIETAIVILLQYLDKKCSGPLDILLECKKNVALITLIGKNGSFSERELHLLFDINSQVTISKIDFPVKTRPVYAASIIRGHNGNIWISSLPEDGALISFELRCHEARV